MGLGGGRRHWLLLHLKIRDTTSSTVRCVKPWCSAQTHNLFGCTGLNWQMHTKYLHLVFTGEYIPGKVEAATTA